MQDAQAIERAAAALETLVAAARLGGEAALPDFRLGERTAAKVEYKAGGSPVTSADLAVDAKLRSVLTAAFPDAGWLSEETEDDPARLMRERLIVLDPIDGTRAFVAGDPCWTVSIALVERGRPIAGVVHAPALGETFTASLGAGARFNGSPVRAAELESLEGATIAGPRALIADVFAAAGFRAEFAPKTPSLAYRFAAVAAGRFAVGLAGPDAHDWDIAAADILLSEAGAGLYEAKGHVSYNQSSTRHDRLLAAPRAWSQRLGAALERARA